MQLDNVPESLRNRKQWVCWKYDERGGKPTKIPLTIGGHFASSTSRSDWYTFDDVVEAQRKHGLDGVGFVFTADDPFVGVDLDDCFTEEGRVKPWALEILTSLDGSYSEVSPSGLGLKVFAIGPALDSGKKAKIDDGAIEVYSSGRFFTVTGDVFSEGEPTDKTAEILELVERYIPKPEPVEIYRGGPIAGENKVERARKYIEHCEPSISGNGGHDKAFRAACVLVVDFDLDTETALSILANDFNPRCVPPWSEKELRHKIEQANKQTGPRGGKLVDEVERLATAEGPQPIIDLGAILGKSKTIAEAVESSRVSYDPTENPFPEICKRPPGLISEIIDYTDSQSLYVQSRMSLAGALALMATITGRKLTDGLGTRTNLYVVALAPSGSGKDASRKTNKKLLKAAGKRGLDSIGPERFGSHAGIISAVAAQPAILFQIDEIGKLLASLKGPRAPAHLANIASVLMQLFTSSDDIWIGDAYADLERTKTIEQPHAVVYGSSVAEGFWGNLTQENVTDGLLGRILPIEVPTRVRLNKNKKTHQPAADLVESVRRWINYTGEKDEKGVDLAAHGLAPSLVAPKLVTASHTPEAWERHIDHLDKISERMIAEDESTAAIWARTGERTSKLALLLAASRVRWVDRSPEVTIDLEDVNRAIAFSNWVTREIIGRVFLFVARNEQEELTKRAYRVVSESPGKKIARSEFTRKTQWLNKRSRNEILETLIEGGLIEGAFDSPGLGKKPTFVLSVV